MLSAREVSAGTRLEPLSVEVESGKMKTVAAIMRDPNPTHYDVETVRSLGLGERLLNQGPANAGYLMEFVRRNAGGAAGVRRFSVRYLSTVHEGDVVVCEGTVTAVDSDAGTAELELSAAVEGAPVIAGSAVIALAP
jgi:hydroxyacyl-ACP dehydratase HTD2-like protein with hotdog domain